MPRAGSKHAVSTPGPPAGLRCVSAGPICVLHGRAEPARCRRVRKKSPRNADPASAARRVAIRTVRAQEKLSMQKTIRTAFLNLALVTGAGLAAIGAHAQT